MTQADAGASRGTRRQRARPAAASALAAGLLVATLGSCATVGQGGADPSTRDVRVPGPTASVTEPSPSGSPTPTPTTVTVTCADAGTRLDTAGVAATSAGVRVRVVNRTDRTLTTPAFWSREPLDLPGARPGVTHAGRTSDWVLALPPGRVEVSCEGLRSHGVVGLDVTDPSGAWQGGATDAGCPMGGVASWVGGPGRGVTPQAAARSWPTGLSHAQRTELRRGTTVERLRAGYRDAVGQPWLVRRDGVPAVLLLVTATREATPHTTREGFVAHPEWICARPPVRERDHTAEAATDSSR